MLPVRNEAPTSLGDPAWRTSVVQAAAAGGATGSPVAIGRIDASGSPLANRRWNECGCPTWAPFARNLGGYGLPQSARGVVARERTTIRRRSQYADLNSHKCR